MILDTTILGYNVLSFTEPLSKTLTLQRSSTVYKYCEGRTLELYKCGVNCDVWILINLLLHRESYPMLLVANKIDLVHHRKVSLAEGLELAARLKVSQVTEASIWRAGYF